MITLQSTHCWELQGCGRVIDGHPLLDIFITFLLGCSSRICLTKTLLKKKPMGKNSSEGKRVQHHFVS